MVTKVANRKVLIVASIRTQVTCCRCCWGGATRPAMHLTDHPLLWSQSSGYQTLCSWIWVCRAWTVTKSPGDRKTNLGKMTAASWHKAHEIKKACANRRSSPEAYRHSCTPKGHRLIVKQITPASSAALQILSDVEWLGQVIINTWVNSLVSIGLLVVAGHCDPQCVGELRSLPLLSSNRIAVDVGQPNVGQITSG